MEVGIIKDVDKTEVYIQELEDEIDSQAKEIKSLKAKLSKKPNLDYKEKYSTLRISFDKLIKEIVPF